jgi:tetratricopeptide (TPR) repeat protein
MGSAHWFYSAADKPRGPVPLEQLLGLFTSGQLPPESLVWRQGLDQWTRADAVPEIAQQLRAKPPDAAAGPAPDAVGPAKQAKPAAREAPQASSTSAPPEAPKAAPPAPAGAEPAVVENPFIAKLREAYALNSRVFAQLAEELRKEGELDEAIRVCRDGLQKHPGYVLARVTLARALTERGDLASARSVLETVIAASPGNAVARRALGDCLDRMGDAEGALEQYRAGLALDPDSDWLRERIRSAADLAPGPPEPVAGDTQASERPPASSEPTEEPAGEPAGATDLDEAPDWPRRAPDDDLPPIPLVDAEESFELENPYDIPTVWTTEAPSASRVPPPVPPAPPAPPTPPAPPDKAPHAAEPEAPRDETKGTQAQAGARESPLHTLEDNELPELLQRLHERGFTGVVVLRREGVEKTLRLEEGQIVFATTSDPDERLGELLLQRSRITLEQFEKASQAVREHRVRLGEALVELEVIDPYEQVELVTDHIRTITFSLFRWVGGSYELREGLLEAPEVITLEMTVPEVILAGIRCIDSWSRVVRGVGGLGAHYLPANDLESRLELFELSPQQRALVDFSEPQVVRALCRESVLPDFDVLKTLWACRVTGVMRRLPADYPGA